MDEDETIAAMVVPEGIPVPETPSPTDRCRTNRKSGSFHHQAHQGCSVVAFWLRVRDVFELIAEMVVPLGMPVPETGSPTTRPVVVFPGPLKVTLGDPLVVVPVKTVCIPVTVGDPLVVVPVKTVDSPVTDVDPLVVLPPVKVVPP